MSWRRAAGSGTDSTIIVRLAVGGTHRQARLALAQDRIQQIEHHIVRIRLRLVADAQDFIAALARPPRAATEAGCTSPTIGF